MNPKMVESPARGSTIGATAQASARSTLSTGDAGIARPIIWGLSPAEVFEAFWRSLGVQCVRSGGIRRAYIQNDLDRHADLYLLLEPGQFVVFDLRPLMERLIWQGAYVTRVRLVGESVPYEERIVLDDSGLVQRIERRYGSPSRSSHRVFLTSRLKVAQRWASAPDARSAWRSIRRSVAASKIDRIRVRDGLTFSDRAADDTRLLHEIISRWDDPDRVIEGIEQSGDGIWRRSSSAHLPLGANVVGPVWLGQGREVEPSACVIGPAFLPDAGTSMNDAPASVRVRGMFDIEMAEGRQRGGPSQSRGGLYPIAKRAFDFCASALALIALSPLLALLSIAVYMDSGLPVLFRHRRQTRGGAEFTCLKFRTMHRDAESKVEELAQLNQCDGPQVYVKDDPRVTRVGRFLRQYHLDELPQLWNVLLGQMSIVGPRPSPESENQYCPAWREMRLSVRPGITGLWQVKRTRSEGEDFQEWIQYDIEYVRSASFWGDLAICFRTFWIILFGRNS